MNKLEKHLQDIKGAVAMMRKMNSINAAAYKTLTEALDEALQIHGVVRGGDLKNYPVQAAANQNTYTVINTTGATPPEPLATEAQDTNAVRGFDEQPIFKQFEIIDLAQQMFGGGDVLKSSEGQP